MGHRSCPQYFIPNEQGSILLEGAWSEARDPAVWGEDLRPPTPSRGEAVSPQPVDKGSTPGFRGDGL